MNATGELPLISQPEGTSLCGQCCVAMLTGASLDEVKASMGEGRNYPRDIRKAAAVFGCNLARHGQPVNGGRGPLGYRAAVLLMSRAGSGTYSHWVVWDRERWLDPKHGVLVDLNGRYDAEAVAYFVEEP